MQDFTRIPPTSVDGWTKVSIKRKHLHPNYMFGMINWLSREIYDWLKDQPGGGYMVSNQSEEDCIFFQREEDAALFLLRWS